MADEDDTPDIKGRLHRTHRTYARLEQAPQRHARGVRRAHAAAAASAGRDPGIIELQKALQKANISVGRHGADGRLGPDTIGAIAKAMEQPELAAQFAERFGLSTDKIDDAKTGMKDLLGTLSKNPRDWPQNTRALGAGVGALKEKLKAPAATEASPKAEETPAAPAPAPVAAAPEAGKDDKLYSEDIKRDQAWLGLPAKEQTGLMDQKTIDALKGMDDKKFGAFADNFGILPDSASREAFKQHIGNALDGLKGTPQEKNKAYWDATSDASLDKWRPKSAPYIRQEQDFLAQNKLFDKDYVRGVMGKSTQDALGKLLDPKNDGILKEYAKGWGVDPNNTDKLGAFKNRLEGALKDLPETPSEKGNMKFWESLSDARNQEGASPAKSLSADTLEAAPSLREPAQGNGRSELPAPAREETRASLQERFNVADVSVASLTKRAEGTANTGQITPAVDPGQTRKLQNLTA